MTTLCWGTVAAATTVDELAAAATAGGFHAISVTPAMGASFAADRQVPMPVASVDALLGVLPGSTPFDEVAPEFRRFFEPGIDGCLRALERTAAPVLNVAHFLGRAAPIAELTDAFGALGERFAAAGARLTLEFIPGTGIPDLPTALAIVTGAGVTGAGVLVDTWHLDRSGGSLDDLRAAPAGTLRALQLSDRRREPEGAAYVPMSDRLLPGDGDLPLRDIVGAVLANHPEADIEVEVFSSVLGALTASEAGARAGTATRRVLQA